MYAIDLMRILSASYLRILPCIITQIILFGPHSRKRNQLNESGSLRLSEAKKYYLYYITKQNIKAKNKSAFKFYYVKTETWCIVRAVTFWYQFQPNALVESFPDACKTLKKILKQYAQRPALSYGTRNWFNSFSLYTPRPFFHSSRECKFLINLWVFSTK